jgi:hypothetical protein
MRLIKDISRECKDFVGELAPKDAIAGILNAAESVFGTTSENVGKYSDFAKNAFSAMEKRAKNINISGIGDAFDNTKVSEYLASLKQVRNLESLSDKKGKGNVYKSIANVAARVKRQVPSALAPIKEKVTDKAANLSASNSGTVSGAAATETGSARSTGFEARNSDKTAFGSESGVDLADILSQLKSIESAIKGNRQFEKKINV